MVLEAVGARVNGRAHAYGEMTTPYHFRVETPEANRSKGTRHRNGVDAQPFNRRSGWVGHRLHGWFKAILVE